MTVTNHMMTGALVALVVKQPSLAIPLALISHFVIDAVPHYGYGSLPAGQRDKQKHFLGKQIADTYFALGLFWLVPFLLRNHQASIITSLCMLVAFIPDAVWSFQYVRAQRQGSYQQWNWFTKFHKAIQWCERPWGIYVEIAWFVAIVVALRAIVT